MVRYFGFFVHPSASAIAIDAVASTGSPLSARVANAVTRRFLPSPSTRQLMRRAKTPERLALAIMYVADQPARPLTK